MTDQLRRAVIGMALLAAGFVLWWRRPVRPPQSDGVWHPHEPASDR